MRRDNYKGFLLVLCSVSNILCSVHSINHSLQQARYANAREVQAGVNCLHLSALLFSRQVSDLGHFVSSQRAKIWSSQVFVSLCNFLVRKAYVFVLDECWLLRTHPITGSLDLLAVTVQVGEDLLSHLLCKRIRGETGHVKMWLYLVLFGKFLWAKSSHFNRNSHRYCHLRRKYIYWINSWIRIKAKH